MKKKYIWALVVGIFILIVPTAVYLGFLIPKMSDEYNILMASGGVITGGGMYGASVIPDKIKYASLFKLSARSFTLLIVITLVQKFIMQIIFCVATFIISYIIFRILLGVYRDGKRRKQNSELAEEISRSIVESTK